MELDVGVYGDGSAVARVNGVCGWFWFSPGLRRVLGATRVAAPMTKMNGGVHATAKATTELQ